MLLLDDVEVDIRAATPDDGHLDLYDNTRLVAINTCPTWGITRYSLHKKMPGGGRAMALEAGSACHEVFAACRIWQLYHIDKRPDHAVYHGSRIFGQDRFDNMVKLLTAKEGPREQLMNFALDALFTSGFYDDPDDSRRTLTNMEDACMAYLDRQSHKQPIWVEDEDDPTARVGIEVAFELVIEFRPNVVKTDLFEYQDPNITIRFAGRMDGIHVHGDGVRPHENKTGARINDAWEQSMLMTHQVTGYCLAASVLLGEKVKGGYVHGLALPIPTTIDSGGIVQRAVSREPHMYHDWFAWLLHTLQTERAFRDTPWDAPKYTHSCNRYFRPCAMIPFCAQDVDERKLILEEMEYDEWSPLHEVQSE